MRISKVCISIYVLFILMTYILSASVYVLYSVDINIFHTLKDYVLKDFDSINIS